MERCMQWSMQLTDKRSMAICQQECFCVKVCSVDNVSFRLYVVPFF